MSAKRTAGLRETLLDLRHRMLDDIALVSGTAAGLLGLFISFALKGLVPARPLGDPVPLILSATQLTRGFLYFPWRPVLLHLLFILFLALLTVVILRLVVRRVPAKDEATRAGRIAGLISVGVVAILAVDALMVGFWYLTAGVVSLLLTGFTAGLFTAAWHSLHKRSIGSH